MKTLAFVLMALCTAAAAGCGAGMANVSNAKSAYVVRQGFLGNNMYYCTAASGKPVCSEVQER